MVPTAAALAVLVSGIAAEPLVMVQGAAPTSTPTSTATPVTTSTSTSAPTTTTTPATTVPATPTAAPTAAAAPSYGSYLVLKGGWFGTEHDFEGESFEGAGEWELAVGTGRVLGIELGVGAMTTTAGDLDVRTVPLLLTLRLGIPIAMVVPHLDLGAGVYFNEASIRERDVDATTAGWHAGLGCDVLLGRLLLGADARYMGVSPTFSTIGEITLDRYAFLLKAGVRF